MPYDTLIPQSYSQANTEGIIPTTWADDMVRFVGPELFWAQYLSMRIDWDAGMGASVSVPLFGKLPDTSWPTLTAGTGISVGSIAHGTAQVTVTEAGYGIGIETILQYLSKYPHDEATQRALAEHWGQAWDNACQAIFTGALWVRYSPADGSCSSLTTNTAGTPAAAGTGTLMTDPHVMTVIDDLKTPRVSGYGTHVVQPFPDGLYRWVANSSTLRSIKREANWVTLQTRDLGGRGLIYSELGEWEGFLFIENNKLAAGTSIIFGQGVGAQGWAGNLPVPPTVPTRQAAGFPVQIRAEVDWQSDFGRAQAYAWYCVCGSAIGFRDTGTMCQKLFTGS